MAEEDEAASASSDMNGLHIVCPNGDSGSWSLDEPRGSKSSRSRSTRGRFVAQLAYYISPCFHSRSAAITE